MKNMKKLGASFLAMVFASSFVACTLPFDLPFLNGNDNDTEIGNTVKVEKISSDLLDGKVANLLSADGVGLQSRTDAPSAKTRAKANVIVASADEPTQQPIHELVKAANDGIYDVRFHSADEGSYREWNNQFDVHHHNSVECTQTDCDEISDEIEAQEAAGNTPTILSLGARVSKLYNGGDYTFVCVTSAVEGDLRVMTEKSMEMSFTQRAYMGEFPTLINLTDLEEGFPSLSYLRFGSGEDKGMILVRRSINDTGFHQANYWSDNYNQSYLIDNATGETYSLAQFPYIYSVTGNLFTVWRGGNAKIFDYYTVSVENGELQYTKLPIPEEAPYDQLLSDNALVDMYGNVVFQLKMDVKRMAQMVGVTLEGEMQLTEELRYPNNNKIIFTGYNEEYFRYMGGMQNSREYGMYQNSNRYFKGTDGKIYNVGYTGSFNNIPVRVLNGDGEWETVPETTSITFAPYTGYVTMVQLGAMATNPTYFTLNEIDGGYAYFSNARWGEPAGYLHGGCMTTQMQRYNYPVGVIKMPVSGGADQDLLALTAKLATQNEDFIYRTGNHSIVYKDGTDLVLWDRKTGVQSVINNVEANLTLFNHYCFSIADKYIPYNGMDFEWAWENLLSTPVEKQVIALDTFYTLLRG